MHFYAARWDGTGSETDPFYPAGTDLLPAGTPWWSLDLRADPTQPGGFCFFATPQPPPPTLPAGVVHLGENPDEVGDTLTDLIRDRFPAIRNQIRRDIPPGERTLRRILRYLLVERAADLGLNPIQRGRNNRLRIWLGELLVDEANA